jgi:hypothetical protein
VQINDSDENVYARFTELPLYQYKILEFLFSNENIWKLLNYNTPDALYQTNLTTAQKRALIYTVNGSTYPQDTTIYRVFLTDLSDDMWNEQSSFMRITLPTIFPTDRTKGILNFSLDILVHTKIDMLNGMQSRKVCLLSNILSSLNGAEIGGVGKLTFNRKLSLTDKAVSEGLTNGKSYSGYEVILSTNYAAHYDG